MLIDKLEDLERNYLTGWERRKVLWARIRERRSDGRTYEHSRNTDAATLKQLDDAGLVMARRIAAAQGVDVDAITQEVVERCTDDAPQF